MATLRLDKLLASSGQHSRSDAARMLKGGLVKVDGAVERDPSRRIDPSVSQVTLSGELITDQRLQYVMLHKPSGVLTAARDRHSPTVMNLVPDAFLRRDVLPVGRLDKDTTGLLLLTNDGELAHRLLAPGRHVVKEYLAKVEGCLSQEDVAAFSQGMLLHDFTAQPAELRILSAQASESFALLFLQEGKFHQVKRMFAARGHPVLSLHRTSFGPLRLSDDLPEGKWRELLPQEIHALRAAAGVDSAPAQKE